MSPFATTPMDPGSGMLSGVSQREKDKSRMISLVCGTLKNKLKEQTQPNQTQGNREQTDDCQRGAQWGAG